MSLSPLIAIPRKDAAGNAVMGIAINPVKQYVKPFWLTPDTLAAALGAQGAANDNLELRFTVDSQGHFEWAYLIGASTSMIYTLEFFDGATQRRLQNRPVHAATIVGSAVRPFRLPEPYFFDVGDSQREIICKIRNLNTVPNTIRLVLHGRRFYHREAPPAIARELNQKFNKGWRTHSYFLVPNETLNDGTVTAVAGGGTATFTFEADSTADTDLQKLMVYSQATFTFKLRERATGRYLMNNAVLSTNGMGNAEFPFYFADSYHLERQKQLLLEVTNLSQSDNQIYATLAGRRIVFD